MDGVTNHLLDVLPQSHCSEREESINSGAHSTGTCQILQTTRVVDGPTDRHIDIALDLIQSDANRES